MAASRSSRVTRSSVGLNGLDENFCGRTLRNRSIAKPEDTSVSPLPRARSPKKKQDAKRDTEQESKRDAKQESKRDAKQESKRDARPESKRDARPESKRDARPESKRSSERESKQNAEREAKQDSKRDAEREAKQDAEQVFKKDTEHNAEQESDWDANAKQKQDLGREAEKKSEPEGDVVRKTDSEGEAMHRPEPEGAAEPKPEQDAEQEPGQDAEQEPEQDGEQEPEQDGEQEPGQDGEQEPGQDGEQEPGQDAEQEPGQDAEQEPGQDAEQEPGQDTEQEPGQDALPEPGQDTEQEPGQDALPEPGQDAEQEPGQDALEDPQQDAMEDPQQDALEHPQQGAEQEPQQDSLQEPQHDTLQETQQDALQEPGQDALQEPGQDALQEPRQDALQEPGQDALQEPQRDALQEPQRDALQEPQQDALQEPQQDALQEPQQDALQEPQQDALQEPGQDGLQEPVQDGLQEPVQDGLQELGQDALQESQQDGLQEPGQDALQESQQDALQEPGQNALHESQQDALQEPGEDAQQGPERDTLQDQLQDTQQEPEKDVQQEDTHQELKREESKQDVNMEWKQDAHQDTGHETKRDTWKDRQLQTSLQGMLNDSNSSTAEADEWSGSRKRSVSCLEKDISLEPENCDRGKRVQDAPPQIKRAKRRSRPGESQGHGEDLDLLKPESPIAVPEPRQENSCDEIASQNSTNIAAASPFLCTEGELSGQEAEGGYLECDRTSRPSNTHRASNGLCENKAEDSTFTEDSGAHPSSATNCPSLLNGSQMGAPTSPDPAVPCRNSSPVQMEVCGSGELSASSALTVEAVPEDPVPDLIVAKEQEVEEVEVDVVGDALCLAHEEQVTESESDTNDQLLTPVLEAVASTSFTPSDTNSSPISKRNSGETTPLLAPVPSPTEPGCNSSLANTPPTFTELYEHRYTLRTSPRRAATGGKSSSSKPNSPPRGNGPLREEGEVVVGLEEECPMVEEPTPSDSLDPPCEEPVTMDTLEHDGPVEGEGTEGGKELRSQATEEDEEDEEEEPDVYYFESDHLALKHNKDYQRLLQTVGVLEAQRTQAILDLETLARHQRGALADPISFVEQLQKRVNLGLPCPQRVVQLPHIAWEQYTSGLGDFEREFRDKKRKTRRLKLIFDKGLPLRPRSPVEPKKEAEPSTMYSSLPTSDNPENGRQTQVIRGRICHSNKPDTFNQLWTVEEQKKLEQLLVKFPPEEVESRRWQKIADELGNRTAKQVASRVQKYFIKLTKAGIPVPGRTPNLCMYTKKASSKRQHHLNKHLYRPSTFLTSYEPPVYMDEDDERSSYYSGTQDPSADDSDDEGVPAELKSLPEYKELLELKRLKKQKLQEIQEDKAGVRHMGFKCDVCGMEPIQGVRWHCQDCPPGNSVDFCSNCSDCLIKTETHKPNHHLEPVYQQETFLDRDYCLPQSTSYNYLDPNYFPANR